MSDDTLRGQIRELVYMNTYAAEDGREWLNQYQMTDRIIELVREALLTPEAVDAVTDELANYDLYDTDVRLALIGALGAAGLGGDGHE